MIGTSIVEFASKGLVRTGKHLAGGLSRTETGGIMDGKIEELKKEKIAPNLRQVL